jgi:hypothetical protein
VAVYQSGRKEENPLPRHQHLDLGFQPPELGEISVNCLSYTVCDILLEQLELAKTLTTKT